MSAQATMNLGVIGLGHIGGAIAANLLADGHALTVFDRDEERLAALTAAGARAVSDPAAVAAAAEVTLFSLPTPEIVDAVAAQWRRGAAPGTALIDLSTNAPAAVRALGERLADGCLSLLEAPLTGGAPGARARKLVFFAGGDDATFARCRPILDSLGRATLHVGPLGAGNTAKLVNSLIAFTTTWVSLEGLSIAAKSGIEPTAMIEAIRAGGASNFYVDKVVDGLDQRGRPVQFAIELAAKDARLVTELAAALGLPAPLAGTIAANLAAAAEGGLGGHDWSDLVEWIERQGDVALRLQS